MAVAMHDSSPERRNLNVLSVSVILYYLAGGKVSGGSLTLNMMNITFSNIDVLRHSVVVFLVWFVIRHWLVNKAEFKDDFIKESRQYDISKYYKFFINNSVEYTDITLHREAGKNIFRTGGQSLGEAVGFGGFMVFACNYLRMFFTKAFLTGYIVPYMLALWAFYLIIFN